MTRGIRGKHAYCSQVKPISLDQKRPAPINRRGERNLPISLFGVWECRKVNGTIIYIPIHPNCLGITDNTD